MTHHSISSEIHPLLFNLRHFRRDRLRPDIYFSSPLRFYLDHVVGHCIQRYCPMHNADVLDVGCGVSRYVFYFRQYQGRYLGTDVQERADEWRKLAGSNGQLHIEFQVNDATMLTALNRTFNFVISITMLEHVERDDLVVQQIGAVLRPQGHVLLVVPSVIARQYLYIGHGYRGYTVEGLQDLMRRAGLDILEMWRLGGLGSFLYYRPCRELSRHRKRLAEWPFRVGLGIAITLDRLFPFAASGYAVVGQRRGKD